MPDLTEGQEYSCGEGCGACGIINEEFECRRTETLDGRLISREIEMVPVSSCCRADVDIWDNIIDDLVDSRIIEIKEVKDGS